MEPILVFVKRRLQEAGHARWPAIAIAAGVKPSIPRKLVYERADALVSTVQPLADYFGRVDRGEEELPAARPSSAAEAV